MNMSALSGTYAAVHRGTKAADAAWTMPAPKCRGCIRIGVRQHWRHSSGSQSVCRAGSDNLQPDQPLISRASRRTILRGSAAGVFCCAACGGGQPGNKASLSKWPGRWDWYDRYFALGMATTMQQYEAEVAPLKRRLFADAVTSDTDVLELGMGTGPNLRYYGSKNVRVTGIDVNTAMAQYAQQAAQDAGLPADKLRLVTGDVQALPFPDQSFDTVVCTLVLCSVLDPSSALAEAARVLRPGGRLLFIEHVLASSEHWGLQLQQRLLQPLQRLAADNCHLCRQTGSLLRSCGLFKQVDTELAFEVPGQGLIAPHIAGIATV